MNKQKITMLNTKNLFENNAKEAKQFILKTFEKTEKEAKEDVEIIRKWLETQPHLPEVTSDKIIEKFLIVNKFSIEVTKEKIDMYYTIRSLIPEIYDNCHPCLPHMQKVADLLYFIPLPKLTEDFCRVNIIKLNDLDVDKYNFFNNLAHCLNVIEVKLAEDYNASDIFIYDLEGITFAHIMKISPMMIKKMSIVLEKVFSNRVRSMHYLNSPVIEALVKLTKTFMKPKLAERIHVHKDFKALYQQFPKNILPKDYGGEELSLFELSELWKKKLVEYKDRFDKLDSMQVNEKLRASPLINDDILGFHGNFKKLSVD